MKENRLFTNAFSEVKYMLFDKKHAFAPRRRIAFIKRAARRETRRNARVIINNQLNWSM